MSPQLHQIQRQILTKLLFQPGASFTELNEPKISSDKFTYHLQQLLKPGYIEKGDSGYRLTVLGKDFANRIDTEKMQFEKQAKLGALLLARRIYEGESQLLCYKRLKEPFFGYTGFPSGKISWGENPAETALREFHEETGLFAKKATLKAIRHTRVKSPVGLLLEDKYFFIHLLEDIQGELNRKQQEGDYFWCPQSEIVKLDKIFHDVPEHIGCLDYQEIKFLEEDVVYDDF